MDVTGMNELALAGWQGRQAQDLGMRMLRHAADQDAAIVQLVAQSTQAAAASSGSGSSGLGIGNLLDVTI